MQKHEVNIESCYNKHSSTQALIEEQNRKAQTNTLLRFPNEWKNGLD